MSGFVDANQTLNSAETPTTHGKLEEPDHSSANWYFTRDEIENHSPSRKDGIDLKRETYFRKSYCTFLQDLGMRLKVPQVTIATAIVFSHRFFLRQSHARNDRYMVATICMFLAGKVEETPRQLKDVILVSYEIRNKKDPAACERIKWQKGVYDAQRELVLVGERLVLTTLGFDLNIHHPYKPLVAAIKKFKVAQNAALAQVAWNFVNDGLRTSLCLQFKPHHIAAGAIFLAAKFLKVKLPSDGEKVWWQEFDVTPRQLEEVSNQMLELYEQNRAGPSSRSSDPSASAGPKTEPAAYVSQPAGAALPPSSNGVHQAAPHTPQETVANDIDSETVHVEQSSLKEESLERHNHIETYNEVDNETSRLHMNNGEQLPPEGEASPDGHLPVRTNEEDGGDIDECELADDANMHDEDLRPREVSAVSETQNDTSNIEPETIDKVKLKAALEKRKKFKSERPDSKPQVDFTDEEELLERELEHGVEAAAEAEKAKHEPRMSNSWSSSDNDIDNRHEDRQGGEDRHELTVDRAEEGELPTSAGPEHARSPRKSFSPEKNYSPPPKRREHGGRDQYHGRRDSSYDKYRHGHNRGDYHHSSHHSYRSDGDWERHRHKDRNWAERDAKRSRYE